MSMPDCTALLIDHGGNVGVRGKEGKRESDGTVSPDRPKKEYQGCDLP